MIIIKRIAILANSRKKSGRCIAGISLSEQDYGQWIRPVSSRPGESLNEFERAYIDNTEPQILDVVDIPLIKSNPHSCQVENWLISTQRFWRKVGTITWNEALQFSDKPDTLWVNGWSTQEGLNDEVPTEISDNFSGSIGMIHIPRLELHKKIDPYNGIKQKILASFEFKNLKYKLSVTDCTCAAHLRDREPGTYSVGESLLTISLGEPFVKNNGQSCKYKLVAAIICKI